MGRQSSAWKAAERRVAKAFGTTRIGPTGRLGPDMVTSWLAIQVKHRKTVPGWLAEALRKIRSQAHENQLGIVVVHPFGARDSWVVLSQKDFQDWFGGDFAEATESRNPEPSVS